MKITHLIAIDIGFTAQAEQKAISGNQLTY